MEFTGSEGDWFYSSIGGEVISMPQQIKICSRISGSSYEEANSNGELIAASINLLNAANSALEFFKKTGITFDNADIYNELYSAIKKANPKSKI